MIFKCLLAGIISFLMTGIGSGLVFLIKRENKNIMSIMFAMSSGIMLAASFYSLLLPAANIANTLHINDSLICSLGIICGGLMVFGGNKIFCHHHNISNGLLMFSITLHNLPEGIAIGVAFGSIELSGQTLMGCYMLTLCLGLQNIPEGSAISFPLLNKGVPKIKSFLLGLMSAITEPIGAIVGYLLVAKINYLMPFLLSLSAGCMIYIIVDEMIFECNKKNKHSMFILIGFIIMMILDNIFS